MLANLSFFGQEDFLDFSFFFERKNQVSFVGCL